MLKSKDNFFRLNLWKKYKSIFLTIFENIKADPKCLHQRFFLRKKGKKTLL